MKEITMATVIDGKSHAARLRAEVAVGVANLQAERGITPGLAVVLVGSNPASEIYVTNKGKMCREAGMRSFDFRLPEDATQEALLDQVRALNADPAVHGILVQLPLPRHMDEQAVIDAINPDKDVDGFHVINAGRLATGAEGLVPCTPLGCILLLRELLGKELAGKHAVVIGRSNIVGKPMAQLLLREDCTVTIVHSRTHLPAQVCRRADILIAAVGQPELVRTEWIKPGAIVIDVGINRVTLSDGSKRLVGDVAYGEALQRARAVTPVPGGVGPMTIACLLANTLKAAKGR